MTQTEEKQKYNQERSKRQKSVKKDLLLLLLQSNQIPCAMNNQIDHRTTTQLLKQTTSIFTSNLITFIFLSFILFTFRSNVENGTHFLTSFIDKDPTLKTLLTRLHFSDHPHINPPPLRHRRRKPFIQLTRVGTLDDDFFSSDINQHRSLFSPQQKPQSNSTYTILNSFNSKLGFSNQIIDNGISPPQIVRPGFSFRFPQPVYNESDELENSGRVLDFQIFVRGLEVNRNDATALFFLVGILSASYGYVILGFLVTYASVLGIVFVAVLNHLLQKHKSLVGSVWSGTHLGLKRLAGFILMKWAVRDALAQLLGIWFFGEIEDQYSFFKIFVRLKLMPFSIVSSWVRGYEKESAGFLLAWYLLDLLVAFILAVDGWVAIVDSRKTGREILKEGCHLLSTLLNPAINIKCLEGMVCGSLMRWILTRSLGRIFASAFLSVMEVYFMVAWLVYYFAAKSKDATSLGRTFGTRELEGLLEGIR